MTHPYTYTLSFQGIPVETGHCQTEAKAKEALRQAEAFMNFEGESIEDQLERLGLK
jgi:hypothetical protein